MGVFTHDEAAPDVDVHARFQSVSWFVSRWADLDGVGDVFDKDAKVFGPNMVAVIEGWIGQLVAADSPTPAPRKLAKEPAKWAVMSYLQKGIRRGRADWTHDAVSILHNSGMASTAWRRLAVIGMEDLGLGALPMLAICTAVVTHQVDVPDGLEWDLLFQVSRLMSLADKDRSLCDITGIGLARSDRYKAATEGLKDGDGTWWKETVTDLQMPICRRVRAYQHLAQYGKNAGMLHAADNILGTPPIVRYITANYKIACKDPMWASMAVMWELATRGGVKVEEVPVTQDEYMAGMPGCVFDMFSFDGKRAFNYFKKASPLAKAFFSERADSDNNKLGYAVFAVEGGNLSRSLQFPMRDVIGYETLVDDFEHVGMDIGEASELCTIVHEDLHLLNKARKAVIKDNLIEAL